MGLRLEKPKKWLFAALLFISIYTLVSASFPRSAGLTAFGDVTQCVLLLAGLLSILSNATMAKGRTRVFWALMTFGFGMWLAAQVLWTYFEVFLRREVPNPFVGDIVLFLHMVPMMAALAVQPHTQQDDHLSRFSSLDFLLLLVWWLYLFLFIVLPWQYVFPNDAVYGRCFNVLYLLEHTVFLCAVGVLWRRSVGAWKTIYSQLFWAALLYAAASIAAGVAIDLHLYYTGSVYDVPLVVALAWFVGVGMIAQRISPESQFQNPAAPRHGIWAARLAMLTVFLMPVMAAWSLVGGNAPQAIRSYRVFLTLGTMLVMGFLVFLKQHLLGRELFQLLEESNQTVEQMRVLKDDLTQKESLLSWQSLELQRKNVELQAAAYTDTLTGLWNRRYLEETLASEAGHALRTHQRTESSAKEALEHCDLVFVMVDVDFFKSVNDEHGHPAGDTLLRRFAQRLSRIMRKSDILIRWGGEEFLILTRSTDRSEITVFCSRILDAVASEPFNLTGGIEVRKTCSIGWAPYPWSRCAIEAICAEDVIEVADIALYLAKSMGRNQSVGFVPSDQALASPKSITIENLRKERSGLIRAVSTPGTPKTARIQSLDGTHVRTGQLG